MGTLNRLLHNWKKKRKNQVAFKFTVLHKNEAIGKCNGLNLQDTAVLIMRYFHLKIKPQYFSTFFENQDVDPLQQTLIME